jgi:hypothetical protein
MWMTRTPSPRNMSSKAAVSCCVAVVDQEAHPLVKAGEAEVARLLGDPGAGRIGGAASEVDAAAAKFDEEEGVEATQRDRFDGEEVTGEHARGLLAKEGRPARRFPPRRRLEPSARTQTPDRAR